MIEKIIIITNNPLTKQNVENRYTVEFIEGSTMDVYVRVRDYIHKGHRLLTHPLAGSVKPNETPYRTVIISKCKEDTIDYDSVNYIESAIHTTMKFIKMYKIPNWSENVLNDFQVIDYDLIEGVLD